VARPGLAWPQTIITREGVLAFIMRHFADVSELTWTFTAAIAHVIVHDNGAGAFDGIVSAGTGYAIASCVSVETSGHNARRDAGDRPTGALACWEIRHLGPGWPISRAARGQRQRAIRSLTARPRGGKDRAAARKIQKNSRPGTAARSHRIRSVPPLDNSGPYGCR